MLEDSSLPVDIAKMVTHAAAIETLLIPAFQQEFQELLKSILELLGGKKCTVNVPGKGLYTIMQRNGLYFWRPKPVGMYGLSGEGATTAKIKPVKARHEVNGIQVTRKRIRRGDLVEVETKRRKVDGGKRIEETGRVA